MKITKVRVKNFKKFIDKEFNFEDKNYISGKNGAGKTAIKEAIIFCIYGTDSLGSTRDASRFIKKDTEMATVEVTFKNEQDLEYKIKRIKTAKGTKVFFIDDSQEVEESNVAQRDLESMIPQIQEFLSVFNVGYFMSLDDKEKRKFLLDLTEKISWRDVFYDLGGTEKMLDKYYESLIEGFNIEGAYKNILERIRNIKNEIKEHTIKLEVLSPVSVPEVILKDKSGEIIRLVNDLDEENKIRTKYNEFKAKEKAIESQKQRNDDIKAQIKEIRPLKDLEEPTRDKINQLIKKRAEFEIATKSYLPTTTCPKCFQKVTSEHREKIKKSNALNKKRCENITKEIEEEEEKYTQQSMLFNRNEQLKIEKNTLEKQIVDIEIPTYDYRLPMKQEKYDDLVEKIRKLKDEDTQYKIQISAYEDALKRKESVEYERNVSEKFISELSGELKTLEKMKEIFSPSGIQAEEMRRRINPVINKFKEYIPGVDIKTLEQLKTTVGVKEVFQLTVNGKEYHKLSTGEKLKVDIATSIVIDDLLNNQIDMLFVDNSESIDILDDINIGQVFIARVNNELLGMNYESFSV